MTTRVMLFSRSSLDAMDDDRASYVDHVRLSLRDHADVALCSAAVPRPSGSSLMPLRRAPRRPDLASGVSARFLKLNRCNQIRLNSSDVLPTQTNPIRCRGGIGAWRSEIKGELTVIDRRGGHSRSYAPVPPRLAQRSSAVCGFLTHAKISETKASPVTASMG